MLARAQTNAGLGRRRVLGTRQGPDPGGAPLRGATSPELYHAARVAGEEPAPRILADDQVARLVRQPYVGVVTLQEAPLAPADPGIVVDRPQRGRRHAQRVEDAC